VKSPPPRPIPGQASQFYVNHRGSRFSQIRPTAGGFSPPRNASLFPFCHLRLRNPSTVHLCPLPGPDNESSNATDFSSFPVFPGRALPSMTANIITFVQQSRQPPLSPLPPSIIEGGQCPLISLCFSPHSIESFDDSLVLTSSLRLPPPTAFHQRLNHFDTVRTTPPGVF